MLPGRIAGEVLASSKQRRLRSAHTASSQQAAVNMTKMLVFQKKKSWPPKTDTVPWAWHGQCVKLFCSSLTTIDHYFPLCTSLLQPCSIICTPSHPPTTTLKPWIRFSSTQPYARRGLPHPSPYRWISPFDDTVCCAHRTEYFSSAVPLVEVSVIWASVCTKRLLWCSISWMARTRQANGIAPVSRAHFPRSKASNTRTHRPSWQTD